MLYNKKPDDLQLAAIKLIDNNARTPLAF